MTTDNLQIRWYSGYIRNWQALCDELSLAKDLSREAREEAILKAAYQKWGMEMTAHLYGAFAFALYDDEQQKLYVVRDQVGQKQMFYTVADGELLCSGDINEIAADPRVEKRLNKRMLQQYLFYGYPIGDETFYEGVYSCVPVTTRSGTERMSPSRATGSRSSRPTTARLTTNGQRRSQISLTRSSPRNAPIPRCPIKNPSFPAASIPLIF